MGNDYRMPAWLRDLIVIAGLCAVAVFVLQANWSALLGEPAAPAVYDPCAGMEQVQAASGVAVCKPAGKDLQANGTTFPRPAK